MYFIRIKPLKEQLRGRGMSDRQALPYYVVFMVCTTLVCALPIEARSLTRWDVLSAVTGTLLTVAGIIYTYTRNGGKAGYDFIQKSIVLGWVVVIRLLALIVLIAIGVEILKTHIGQSIEETSWVDVVFVALFLAIYFQRLGRHIKDTHGTKGESCHPPLPRVPAGPSEGEG